MKKKINRSIRVPSECRAGLLRAMLDRVAEENKQQEEENNKDAEVNKKAAEENKKAMEGSRKAVMEKVNS